MGDIQYILADNEITQNVLNDSSLTIQKTSSNMKKYTPDLYWHPTVKHSQCLADQSI